jgi:sensor histidine kinase YesM
MYKKTGNQSWQYVADIITILLVFVICNYNMGIRYVVLSVICACGILIVQYTADKKSMLMGFLYTFAIITALQVIARFSINQSLADISTESGDPSYGAGLLVSGILEYTIACLVGKTRKVSAKSTISRVYWVIIFVLPVFSLYMIMSIYGSNMQMWQFVLITIMMLGINIGVIYLYDALNIIYERYLKNQVMTEQNNFYQKQLQMMSEAYATIRSVKHDIKNNLNTIKSLTEQGETKEVVRYIDQINHSSGFQTTVIDTGNHTLDGILNYKIQEAQNRGITIVHKLSVPQKMPVDPFDLSVIIGNLLDNAVREVAKTDDKAVYLTIQYTKGNFIIVVKNKYIEKEVPDTKKQSSGIFAAHGIGLKNVRKVVEKYKGELVIKKEDDIFTARVLCAGGEKSEWG